MDSKKLKYLESKAYLKDDLGAMYTKTSCKFTIWAPLSKKVFLVLVDNENSHEYEMDKRNDGTFSLILKGDYLNQLYCYKLIDENGNETITNDPYSKGCGLNSLYSAVVDVTKVKNYLKKPLRCELQSKNQAVIYEVGIRDFTEDKHTDIVDKGLYSGFCEKGRKTKNNNKAGLDYLLSLGISHIQLNPVIDFANVDDNAKNTYNWGYDPISFFNLEGSYSKNPSDPSLRLFEFKKLVSTMHENGIGVILDVVYNHIFQYEFSCFEKIVPGYYFRQDSNGKTSNGSGCGNELATERKMVRKIILDSIKYFIEVFDVDGFRFDLMGLIDIDTMNKISSYVYSKKPKAFLYGEGWNMGEALPFEKKSCMENYKKLHGIAFFNDQFRDNIGGSVFDMNRCGYCCGNTDVKDSLPYLIKGQRFSDPLLTINYVECHDNTTLYDRICAVVGEDNKSLIFARLKMANALTLFSCGISFIHMGQEIGLSKHNLHNTYNVKKVNNFAYDVLDERVELAYYFQDLVRLKKVLPCHLLTNNKDIEKAFAFNVYENGVVSGQFLLKDCFIPSGKFVINPNSEPFNVSFDDYMGCILSTGGIVYFREDFTTKNIVIPKASFTIYMDGYEKL